MQTSIDMFTDEELIPGIVCAATIEGGDSWLPYPESATQIISDIFG